MARQKTDKTKFLEGIEALINGDFTGEWEYKWPIPGTSEYVEIKSKIIVGKPKLEVVKEKEVA